ncbi:MAG: hypothetical protein AB7E72_15220 [Lysobacterales bacterium]
MSGNSRFERLENEIVDALRRAPGAEPSADLDARILARAHAAVAKAPQRRSQPRWMSLAAGVVVLVGSGLALRIWQQLEHEPSRLDAPPAVSAPAPMEADHAADDNFMRSAEKRSAENAGFAEGSTLDSEVAADRSAAAKPAAPQPQPRSPAPQTSSTAASGPAPAAKSDDRGRRDAQPFPAELAPKAPAVRQQEAVGQIVVAAPPTEPRAEPVTAQKLAPAPAAAPPVPYAVIEEAMAPEAKREHLSKEMPSDRDASTGAAGLRMPAELSGGRANDASSKLSGAADAPAAMADKAIDAFDSIVEEAREALKRGDMDRARRLIQTLRQDYPKRELPQDLRFADDANH